MCAASSWSSPCVNCIVLDTHFVPRSNNCELWFVSSLSLCTNSDGHTIDTILFRLCKNTKNIHVKKWGWWFMFSNMSRESKPQNRHCLSSVDFVDNYITTSKCISIHSNNLKLRRICSPTYLSAYTHASPTLYNYKRGPSTTIEWLTKHY